MRTKYTVFCLFDLKPHYFYLFVNFLDIAFNNFNLTPSGTDHEFHNLESVLCRIANSLNGFLTVFGLFAFFTFLYRETFNTMFHKIYIILRWLICYIRLAVFTLSFIVFLYAILKQEIGIRSLILQLSISAIVVYIEINDVIWSYWLKQLIFADRDELKELYQDKFEIQFEDTEELDKNKGGVNLEKEHKG